MSAEKAPWPFRRPLNSLGLKITATSDLDTPAIGWGVLRLTDEAGGVTDDWQEAITPDPVSTALEIWRQNNRPAVRLPVYTEETFPHARAAREGGTLQQHTAMMHRLAEMIETEGGTVEIVTVTLLPESDIE